jgi:hypothetical protein
MKIHVYIVAALRIFSGGVGIVASVIIFVLFLGFGVFGGITTGDEEAYALAIIGPIIGLCVFFLSLPELIGGLGLLKFRKWARILILIVSIIGLIQFPLGTAFGIYSIWVLFHKETIGLFEQQSRKA